MPRIRADLDDDTQSRVEKYADENGLLRRRAYADLIEAGLDALECDDA